MQPKRGRGGQKTQNYVYVIYGRPLGGNTRPSEHVPSVSLSIMASHLIDGVGVLVDILHWVHPAVVERPEVMAAGRSADETGAPGSRGRAVVTVDASRQRCILICC